MVHLIDVNVAKRPAIGYAYRLLQIHSIDTVPCLRDGALLKGIDKFFTSYKVKTELLLPVWVLI